MTYSDNLKRATDYLVNFAGAENVRVNEPMKGHTSFKTGGAADLLVTPKSVNQLAEIIKYLSEKNMPFFVIGNGTNLLVRDKGYRGVVIKIREIISSVHVRENIMEAEAGALLSSVAKAAYENGLKGLEFAEGIPGTLGGAIAMNAGAYGGEMKDVVATVTALDLKGNSHHYDNEAMGFCYRSSLIQRKGLICVSARFALEKGDKKTIKTKMDENRQKRTEKQPLDLPSAGSTFKRPEGFFAGKLIMDSGLRGYRIGGASISEMHCGFVVNDGGASASDIIALIEFVQKTVEEKFGVSLEPEVKIIGE